MKKLFLIPFFFLLTACVERSIQVDSTPRGAMVVLDEVKMGYTPITIPFSHYGVRKIRVEKPGYVKKTLIADIQKPWYENPGIDFFADVLWPFVIEDNHFFKLDLKPLTEDNARGLMERANEAREILEKRK